MSTFEETQANDEQYLNRNRCSGEAYRFFTNNIGNVMSGSETETFRQPSPSVSYTTSHNALTTFNSFVNSNDFGNIICFTAYRLTGMINKLCRIKI